MSGHPRETQLALYAGGDLSSLGRWLVARHLSACNRCREDVAGYREASTEMLQSAAVLPKDLNWERLSAEMQANIHVGLAAGECVGGVPDGRDRIGWKAALVMASITLLIVTGWFLNAPRQTPAARLAEAGIVLETTSSEIQMKENGAVFSLRHPASDGLTVSVSGQGSVRARYLDAETGQVTIHNVYAE
jgi:anti-sigma factor RsiW